MPSRVRASGGGGGHTLAHVVKIEIGLTLLVSVGVMDAIARADEIERYDLSEERRHMHQVPIGEKAAR